VSTIVLIYLAPFANECFGEASLTVRGRVPFIDGIGGCCLPIAEPAWLAGHLPGGFIDPGKVGTQWRLQWSLRLQIPPGIDAKALRARDWVEIDGHYADELADTCRRTPLGTLVWQRLESQAAVRRDCEQRFVVESIAPVNGP
jgi:hypothetical protein